MSLLHLPKPVKLIIGIVLKDRAVFPAAVDLLKERFGAADLIGSWFPFDLTNYYEPEMGGPLFRRMLAFETLVSRDALASIKIETNGLEAKFLQNGKRKVNLDPGYVAREHIVLATGKSFSHRISIGQGVYADLTLLYQKGAFVSLPWTYPDYRRSDMLAFLKRVRDKYVLDLKNIYDPADRI